MDRPFQFDLGVKVKDKVSGLQGTIILRSEHMNGCHRYIVQPYINKEGKVPDSEWMDEHNIELLENPKKKPAPKSALANG